MNIASLFAFQDQNWLENPEFFFQEQIECENGKVLKRYEWNSAFERRLQETLKDPSKARRIETLYTSILLPSVEKNSKLREEVEQWIIEHAGFLGAFPVQYQDSFSSNFRLAYLINNSPYKEAVERFFHELRCSEAKEALSLQPSSTVYRVAIITSKTGGGHVSTANAISEELQKAAQFETHIVDVDVLSDESHPLFQVSGSFGTVDLYNKLYQQETNIAKIDAISKAVALLRQFVPDRSMEALKCRIREIQPDLIVSTCAHVQEHAFLASDLALPVCYVHTDFSVNPAALKTMRMIRGAALSFFVPSADCLPPNQKDAIEHEIEFLGYPLSRAFTREPDEEKLNKIRQAFGVAPEAKVIVIMMGKQGAGNITFETVQKLISATSPVALHIAVICGENSALKTDIENLIQKQESIDPNLSFHIYQKLTQQQLADYYKISDLLIGKAGGATTAEVRQMGVRLLECGSHPWETPNIQYLLKHSACRQMDMQNPLLPQILDYLRSPPPTDSVDIVDWRALIQQKLASCIQRYRQDSPLDIL